MNLNELFTNYNRVDPLQPTLDEVPSIYNNLNKVQKALHNDWKVKNRDWAVGGNSNYPYDWKVRQGNLSDFANNKYNNNNDDSDAIAEELQPSITPSVSFSNSINFSPGDEPWYVESRKNKYAPKKEDLEHAKYWIEQAERVGWSPVQAVALAGGIFAECRNDHTQVNTTELKGLSTNRDTWGWTGAGEGLVQFTTWTTKRDLIKKYNKDPRRTGEKLTTDPNEYSKNDTRHIVDIPKQDAILFIEYYYQDLIDSTKNDDFETIMSKLYLRKAGNHSKNKRNKSFAQQAWETGIFYNEYHNRQRDRKKPIDSNNFAKAVRFTMELGKYLGMIT